jgi:hypothetical protein
MLQGPPWQSCSPPCGNATAGPPGGHGAPGLVARRPEVLDEQRAARAGAARPRAGRAAADLRSPGRTLKRTLSLSLSALLHSSGSGSGALSLSSSSRPASTKQQDQTLTRTYHRASLREVRVIAPQDEPSSPARTKKQQQQARPRATPSTPAWYTRGVRTPASRASAAAVSAPRRG